MKKNKKKLEDYLERVLIGDGKWIIVDKEDLEYARSRKWSIHVPSGYVYRTIYMKTMDGWSRCDREFFHRRIMGIESFSKTVIHINGDLLDNRKSNLKVCSKQERQFSKKKTKAVTSSKYKGVYWSKARNRWHAHIKKNGVRQSLGFYDNEDDAGKAYNEAALKLFGEHARLNEI